MKLAKELSQITVQKVLEQRSNKLAKALGEVYDHVVDNKETYMAESAKGLETIWKIIMTANGQATSISKNDNTNTHNLAGDAFTRLLSIPIKKNGSRKA